MLDEEMFEVRGVSNISSCDNATTSLTHAHVRTAVPSRIVALDGYPASLGFPVMHRVHAICTQS